MNLYLLRHGEAEAQESSRQGRQLTELGREQVVNVARQFAARNLPLDCCYVSPALRASQTAETFLFELFTPIVETVVTDTLRASSRASEVMTFLNGVQADNLLLVSHNPVLSELLALMTAGNIDHMRILGTAHLACVTLDVIGLGMGVCSFILEPDSALIPAS